MRGLDSYGVPKGPGERSKEQSQCRACAVAELPKQAVMVARVEPYSTVQEGQHQLRLNSHDEPSTRRVCLFWMSLVLVLHTTSVQ